MRRLVSRAMMVLVIRGLGESRREWARAMEVELEAVSADGEALAFAAGCLVAAWGEMPRHFEGRHVLATYVLALGVLVPMAALQSALALGFSSALMGAGSNGVLLAGASHNPLVAWSQVSAVPCLLALWLLLGVGHLRLAWALVEWNWSGVVKAGALIGAALVTLLIVTAVLQLDLTFVGLQALAIGVEFALLVALAQRQERLLARAAQEMPVR